MSRLTFVALLGVWLCGFCCPAGAAPVPPAPRLSEAILVGEWDYAYGQMPAGRIALHADGAYTARHSEGGQLYAGRWWVDRGSVVLIEWRVCPEGDSWGPQRYTFTLDPRSFAGETPSGTPVALSNPKR